jgi:hypothetical protein
MTAIPDIPRLRRQRPVTAYSHVSAATPNPVFIDPYMPGAGGNRPCNRMPCGTNGYIDLGAGLDRSCTDDQHNEKCQFYHFRFHKLVFKLKHWMALK